MSSTAAVKSCTSSPLREMPRSVAGGQTPAHHLIDPGGVAVDSTGAVYLADFDPIRSGPSRRDRRGGCLWAQEVEQRSLSVLGHGRRERDLGGGLTRRS